jgi:hypothetical protein
MAKKNITIDEFAAASQEQCLALEKKIDTVEGKVDVVLSAIENLSGQTQGLRAFMF